MAAKEDGARKIPYVVKESKHPLGDTCLACGQMTQTPCGIEALPGCSRMADPACDRPGFVPPEE